MIYDKQVILAISLWRKIELCFDLKMIWSQQSIIFNNTIVKTLCTLTCVYNYPNQMGGEVSTQPSISSSRKTIEDQRYGGLVYLSPNTATAYQLVHTDKKHLSSLQLLINRRKTLLHPNLLTLRSHFVKDKSSSSLTCGQEPKIELYLQFPYLTRSFEDVMEEYSIKGINIPQKELVKIFLGVASALQYLSGEGTCHGDVKARVPKLIDSYFVNGGKTAYEIVLENPSSMSLLAPQQLDRIKFRRPQDLSTIHMSEIFALGLTLIEAMTFEPAMECYNLSSLQIISGYHERKIQQLSHSSYSRKLCQLSIKCIDLEPTSRPTFKQIVSFFGG